MDRCQRSRFWLVERKSFWYDAIGSGLRGVGGQNGQFSQAGTANLAFLGRFTIDYRKTAAGEALCGRFCWFDDLDYLAALRPVGEALEL